MEWLTDRIFYTLYDGPSLGFLWAVVIGSGLVHGINPAMGWPMVAAQRNGLRQALRWLVLGHALIYVLILLPFPALFFLTDWRVPISRGAGGMMICIGVYALMMRQTGTAGQMVLCSCLAALSHGAVLIVIPISIGLCSTHTDVLRLAGLDLITDNILSSLAVGAVHIAAMATSGAILSMLCHRWLAVRAIGVQRLWPFSVILVGAFGVQSVL